MKKVLTSLIILLFLIFAGLTFYVFEIPPLNPGGPFISAPPQQHETADTENASTTTNPEDLPDFLQENGSAEAKTFNSHMERGNLLENNGYGALAIAEYESASKMDPQSPKPFVAIGRVHFENGDYIKAKLALDEAIKIDSQNIDAQILLGRTHIADRDLETAKTIFDGLLLQNQESKYYQAILAAVNNDHEIAKILFNEVISLGTNPTISTYAQNFLNAYAEFDSNQGGIPIHLQTLIARGAIKNQEFNLAIPILFDVIQEKNNYRDAWILLGYAYLNVEKYQDAVDALDEARKLDSQKPEISFLLGLGYIGLQDLNNAVNYLRLAKENGYQPVIHVDQKLAEVFIQLEQFDEAAESYENVIELNSEDLGYFIKPIWIYIDKINEPHKAVELAKKAHAAHPEDAMSYNLLGWAATANKDYESAENYLVKARTMNPNLDAAYLNYGILKETIGDMENAIQNYKKAYELGKGNSIAKLAFDRYNNAIKNR